MDSPSPASRVKVCGITRAADAEALDALKVDYLGFNFHPGSKRFVEPRHAADMIARLRNAEPVGVFVNAPPERIEEVAALTGIRWVQLHGNEAWGALERISLPVIKAVPHTRLGDFGGLREEWEARETRPRYFLVDTQAGPEFGGSGEAFDWKLLKTHSLPLPFFLAGGIGPQNLAEALNATRPFAVDLNSKVEVSPGVKDLGLVKKCLRIAAAVNRP